MKSNKDFRAGGGFSRPDDSRRDTKLPPIKKSGKERHALYSEFEEEEDMDIPLPKKESVFDYFEEEEDI